MDFSFDPQTNMYYDAMGNPVSSGGLNIYTPPTIKAPVLQPVTTQPLVAPMPPQAPQVVSRGALADRLPVPQPEPAAMPQDMGTGALMDMPRDGGFAGALSQPMDDPMGQGALAAKPADDGLFSFMNKPGASDSLMAFGSAMLKAPNFNTGLADAATAVNEVAKQYRGLTPREIDLMRQKAAVQKMISGGGGPEYASSQVGYAPALGYIPTRFNKSSGVTEYQLPDGSITSVMPEGFQQRTDSNVGEFNTFDETAYNEDWKNLQPLTKNISQFDDMINLAPQVNAGGDAINTLKRKFNSFLGTDFGADLSDVEYFEKLNNDAQLEIAQGQKGLGQFTEMEREIVARSIPNISTQEQTIIQVGLRLKIQAQMKQEMISAWGTMPASEKQAYGGYRAYVATKLAEYKNDYARRYEEEIARIASSRGGPSAGSGPAVGTVQQGYRFKGGDPSNQSNWEKVN